MVSQALNVQSCTLSVITTPFLKKEETNQERCRVKFYLMHFTIFTVVNHIPTTTVTLITCVVGIPLLMFKNTEYE